MSYVIHLFEHASPATLDEATQLHERLSVTRAGRNERMLLWAKGMQARFPGGHAGWLEGPPNGDTDGMAVLSVGLTSAGLDKVLPAAVSLALPLGLCVFDEQAGRCYLPGGWALTQRGRFQLKGRDGKPPSKSSSSRSSRPSSSASLHAIPPSPPPPPAPRPAARPLDDIPEEDTPVATNRFEPGSWQWAQQKLQQRIEPGLAVHGFQASLRANLLRFARVTPMGFQCLTLLLRDGLRVEPSVSLEPVLPHALYRAVRPGRTLSCHTHRFEPLRRFGAQAETRPGHNPWYSLRCGEAEIDALGDALLQWTVDNFLPLFDACQDLRGILRSDGQRQQSVLPAFVAASRSMLALRHWVEGRDLVAQAEALAAELQVQAEIPLRSAKALRALPVWAGAWRPMPVPCLPYEFHEAVTAPSLAQAALPRLRKAAQARGFQLAEETPLSAVLRRESEQVVQSLRLEVKPGATAGAELKVSALWEAPALAAHWCAAWPGAPAVSELGAWQSQPPPSYFWMRGPLEAAGIDHGDFNAHIQWPDQVADHVQYAEQSLRQWCERVLDPAMSWQGLAKQLPTADDFKAWQRQHWMGTSLAQLPPGGWAALLMLSSLFRSDAQGYAAAMRAAAVHVREVEPLLRSIEQAGGIAAP